MINFIKITFFLIFNIIYVIPSYSQINNIGKQDSVYIDTLKLNSRVNNNCENYFTTEKSKKSKTSVEFSSSDSLLRKKIVVTYLDLILEEKIDSNNINCEILLFYLLENSIDLFNNKSDTTFYKKYIKLMKRKLYTANETIPFSFSKIFIVSPKVIEELINRENAENRIMLIEELYLLETLIPTSEKKYDLVNKTYDNLINSISD